MVRRYKIIGNPAAGKGRGEDAIVLTADAFRKRGLSFDLQRTQGPWDARDMARSAIGAYDVIVAVGGDGTLNEIVQAMAHTDTPLGVIPAGSGNDFGRAINLPGDIEGLVGVVQRGSVRRIDLGRANGRYFINAFGLGLDAKVGLETQKVTFLKGHAAYIYAMLKSLASYRPCEMRISINGAVRQQKALLFTAGNGITVGGGFKLTPHASLDDGLLDVTAVEPMWLPVLFWHLPKVFIGTIDRVKYAWLDRTTSLRVESAKALPSHVDGEIFSTDETCYKIDMVPSALNVITNL